MHERQNKTTVIRKPTYIQFNRAQLLTLTTAAAAHVCIARTRWKVFRFRYHFISSFSLLILLLFASNLLRSTFFFSSNIFRDFPLHSHSGFAAFRLLLWLNNIASCLTIRNQLEAHNIWNSTHKPKPKCLNRSVRTAASAARWWVINWDIAFDACQEIFAFGLPCGFWNDDDDGAMSCNYCSLVFLLLFHSQERLLFERNYCLLLSVGEWFILHDVFRLDDKGCCFLWRCDFSRLVIFLKKYFNMLHHRDKINKNWNRINY